MQVTKRDFLKLSAVTILATFLPLPKLAHPVYAKPRRPRSAWKVNKEWGGESARARGPFTFDTGGQII